MPAYFWNGKWLFDALGRLAMSIACCCRDCGECPFGTVPEYLYLDMRWGDSFHQAGPPIVVQGDLMNGQFLLEYPRPQPFDPWFGGAPEPKDYICIYRYWFSAPIVFPEWPSEPVYGWGANIENMVSQPVVRAYPMGPEYPWGNDGTPRALPAVVGAYHYFHFPLFGLEDGEWVPESACDYWVTSSDKHWGPIKEGGVNKPELSITGPPFPAEFPFDSQNAMFVSSYLWYLDNV